MYALKHSFFLWLIFFLSQLTNTLRLITIKKCHNWTALIHIQIYLFICLYIYVSSPTFFQRAGTRASYMQSSASLRFWLMMMVPSMASLRSVSVLRTRTITRCMRSTSCRRKMFIGWKGPIFWRRSRTWSDERSDEQIGRRMEWMEKQNKNRNKTKQGYLIRKHQKTQHRDCL